MENPRECFDSAYANLESTVRNFNRDKLRYEESIAALNRKIVASDEVIQENNRIIQTLLTENEKLDNLHDEDHTSRCAVDAMLANTAMKQEFLLKTLEDFQCLEKEVIDRYVSIGDFIDCLKGRQVQLYEWNGDLQRSLQEEKTQLHEMELRFAETQANHAREIEKITNKTMSEKIEVQEKVTGLEFEIKDLVCKNNELTQSLEDSEQKLTTSEMQTAESKAHYEKMIEEQTNKTMSEKKEVQEKVAGLEFEIKNLVCKTNELTQSLEDSEQKLSTSKMQTAESKAHYEKMIEEQTNKTMSEKKEVQEKVAGLEFEIKNLVCKNNELTQSLEDSEQKLSTSKMQTAESKAHYEKMIEEQTNQALNEKMEFEQKFTTWQMEMENLISKNNEMAHNLQNLEEKLSTSEMQTAESKAHYKKMIEEQTNKTMSEKKEVQEKVAGLEFEIKNLVCKNNELTQSLEDSEQKLSTLEMQTAESKAHYEKMIEEQTNQALNEKMEFQQKFTAWQIEMENLTSKNNEMVHNLQNLEEKLSTLEMQTAESKAHYEKVIEEQTARNAKEQMELKLKVTGFQSEVETLAMQKSELTQHLQDLNDKMSEAEKRKSRRSGSFHLPSSSRKPMPPPPAVSGILKRNSTEKNTRVSFNKNVEVRKFNAITISSSDSESDMLDLENKKKALVDPVPPKKQRISEIKSESTKDRRSDSSSEKQSNMDTDSPVSPRKFFKNRSSPLTYNNCKSPKVSNNSS